MTQLNVTIRRLVLGVLILGVLGTNAHLARFGASSIEQVRAANSPDEVIASAALIAAAALSLWVGLIIVLQGVGHSRSRLSHHARWIGDWITPQVIRQLVIVGLGATGVVASGAAAAQPNLPIIDRVISPAPQVAHQAPVATVTVRPGDSLWSLAETQLKALAHPTDAAAITDYWPQIYRANRDQIGPNVSLIHPGMTLDLPAFASAGA